MDRAEPAAANGNARVLVATTTAAWRCDGRTEIAWLEHAPTMLQLRPNIHFFCALETNGRDGNAFGTLLGVLDKLPSTVWRYSLDDGVRCVDSTTRLVRICMGRNLAQEFAMRGDYTHVLFLDTDVRPPADAIEKLLEVDRAIVGGDVPAYGLSGPVVSRNPPIQAHWNTAGFLLVRRDALTAVWWGWNRDRGMSDDPHYQDAQTRLGFGPTWVRKDVIGIHVGSLRPVESRCRVQENGQAGPTEHA